MRKALLLVALMGLSLSWGPSHADTVYKWVDAQGNVHYTDHPHAGAQKVQLPKTQTYQPPSMDESRGLPPPPPRPAANSEASTPASGSQQFSIASPANQANLWYVHKIPVSVSLSPGLRQGDTLTFRLDSQTIGPTTRTSVTFKDVARGEHTVSVSLNRAGGQTLSAGPITVYVHQKSIIRPKPPH